MKVCSKANRIFSDAFSRVFATIGSSSPYSGAPPRSSSQLEPHSIFIGLPVSSERGAATG
ncbi:hypothetical protein EES47_16910 [Streptomyces sp. ADI98-12]|uniref:Uncharacterized protein n=1 Tax=Streptomyces griseus TaxID=1911 RepID=A0A380P4Q2_STRGR|nr:hypothetical protein EES47_16910 [Streptomyces sp. ADI98-12]SUP60189.1 Uncharacterised protein [Streptomyces griseus]